MTNPQKLKMLHGRAGFGLTVSGLKENRSVTEWITQLTQPTVPQPLEVVTQEEWQEYNPKAMKAAVMTDEERKMKRKSFRDRTGDLNLLWLRQMVETGNPFQEKMALFWHGHFATRIDNPYFDQLLLQDMRRLALGSFSDLLKAVSKSASMLQFLNNQQNKKQHPNENFAREVMELFTLGRGNYTETDVKEAARAFTGWGYGEDGAFIFRERQHDSGSKTILGKTGNFNGDNVLDILLDQRQTALFITGKLYRFFVNEEAADKNRIQALARTFFDSRYDIGGLMQEIFSSDWFYSREHRGAHIKSPVELLVGLQRAVPLTFKKERTLINLQRVLGQQLFYPPNVAGWPGGKAWIDSSSLVIRMQLPQAFFSAKELDLRAKEQDAEEMDVSKKPVMQDSGGDGRFKIGGVSADWTEYIDHWKADDGPGLARILADFLLPVTISDAQLRKLAPFVDNDNTADRIRSLTILLMSLPEYQLS